MWRRKAEALPQFDEKKMEKIKLNKWMIMESASKLWIKCIDERMTKNE